MTTYAVPSLMPQNSVDTSNINTGVNMFTIVFDSQLITDGTVFQVEYWINHPSTPMESVMNGFIPIENPNCLQTTGIINQTIIGIPVPQGFDGVYNPENPLDVKVRVYAGSNSTGQILVTPFSLPVSIHNPPTQPIINNAYLIASDYDPYYYNNDQIIVQLNNEPSYDESEIKFIVAYYYIDNTSSEPRWEISDLTSWQRYTLNSETIIQLDQVTLPEQVSYGDVVNVAVHAVYKYGSSPNFYYAVSEISNTEQTEPGAPGSPSLKPIKIPDDYLVYSDNEQTVVLNWLQPSTATIPGFIVDNYQINCKANDVEQASITVSGDTTEYNYDVSSFSCDTTFVFSITAIYADSGLETTSNEESVNYFEKAENPLMIGNTVSPWANAATDPYHGYDIAVVWRWNTYTLSNGCGDPIKFQIDIYNDEDPENPVYTDYYESNPLFPQGGVNNYIKYLQNVPTTPSGTVKVSLVTEDTNGQGGVPGIPLEGSYSADELPIIYDVEPSVITPSTTQLTFKVATNSALDAIARFIYFDTTPLTLTFNTADSDPYNNYSVTQETNPVTGDFIYNFTFDQTFFTPSSTIPNNLVITVSNNYGIGYRAVL